MRSRFFWGTTAVAAFVLAVVGVGISLVLQVLTARTTREEMARQAAAIELIVNQQFQLARAEGIPIDRLEQVFTDNVSDRTPRRSFRVFLAGLLEAARDVSGGSRVELALLDLNGRITPLTAEGVSAELPIDAQAVAAGRSQLLDLEDELILVRPFGSLGVGANESTVLLLVARETPVVDWGRIARPLVLTLAAAALLAALLARLLSSWLVKRLHSFVRAAREIAAGVTQTRVEVGKDELGDLAHSFNEMADRLEEGRARERQFLMSVGHDLRTPLTTITGYAEALEEGRLSPEDVSRVGSVLSAETGRLRRLVEDLMLLARLEAREFTLLPEPVDAAAHLEEVATAFAPRAERDRVRLEVEVEPTGQVVVDPDRLAQIAGNLLENALRYTPEAGLVRLQARKANGHLEMVVSDTGPGIEPEDLPHAFEKLYAARQRVRPEGSGLGLSIVRELADAMGGSVSLGSEAGSGTTVTVRVPV